MSARRRPIEVGMTRGRRLVVDLARELDAARRSSGLSYAALGRAVGLSGDQVARICRAESPDVSIVTLATLLAGVGLDLWARAFPGGLPVRDAAHFALLRRLKLRLAPSLAWNLEVPVVTSAVAGAQGLANDRRAWDAVIRGDRWSIGVEAETRLGDVQALLRRLALKERDGSVDFVLLLVNDTAHNRRVLSGDGFGMRTQYLGTTRRTLRSLGAGLKPETDSVVVL